jgi:tetratricopeptide (TPR) repeat protein
VTGAVPGRCPALPQPAVLRRALAARARAPRRTLALVLAVALSAVLPWGASTPARAQDRVTPPLIHPPPDTAPDPAVRDKFMLLRRVEGLVGQGRLDEAVALLEGERAKGPLDEVLERRLINLYRDAGRNAQLEALLGERIQRVGKTPELRDLRLLAESRFDLGKTQDAIKTLTRIVDLAPEDPGVLELVAKALAEHGEQQRAVQLLLDARKRIKRPAEFAQQLGSLYAQLGRPQEAIKELLAVVVESPANVLLLRGQILELADHSIEQGPALLQAVESAATRHPEVKQLALLVAELRLRSANEEGAWNALAPLVRDGTFAPELLQLSLAALGDSRLAELDPAQRLRSLTLCERVLRGMLDTQKLGPGIEPRAFDALNRVYLSILENAAFQDLPAVRQQAMLDAAHATLLRMAKRSPDNPMTNAALLRLAQFYVSTLHRPQEAIELYLRLSVSPNAGREELQLARVGLGTAYMAAGDTARTRELFTAMGRDMSFMPGQGRAHYYLGMLDFMGGQFKTAQDRLASVALEAASADYTNDALDLALILAEELLDHSRTEHPALTAYGQSLYFSVVARPDSLEARLRQTMAASAGNLHDRARLDLARLLARQGQVDKGLAEIDALVKDTPRARVAPAALELKGDLLQKRGDTAGALAAYEAVLTGHEDYVFAEAVRDKARTLRPGAKPGTPPPPAAVKGELP